MPTIDWWRHVRDPLKSMDGQTTPDSDADYYGKPPPQIVEEVFEELPTMAFEPYLLAPWQRDSLGHPIEVPVCIGGPLVCLRDKHEDELKCHHPSFVETLRVQQLPGSQLRECEDLATWAIFECTTFEACREALFTKTARYIFEVFLKILARLEIKPYPISEKTRDLVNKLSLLEPVHPYGAHINQVLFDAALAFSADPETAQNRASQHNTASTTQSRSQEIVNFIQQTYKCSNVERQQKLRLTNIFNKSMFQDLYMVMEAKMRNSLRFIIRNLIFIIRRYTNQACADLKVSRNETWLLNMINMRPQASEFAMREIAQRIGPLLFRFPLFTCLEFELATRTMMNIFCANNDKMWLSGQKIESILTETGPPQCHTGCICQGYT